MPVDAIDECAACIDRPRVYSSDVNKMSRLNIVILNDQMNDRMIG
ncbi:hypothetical protein C7S15_8581 [Burkholderia cepacia]|nr:hypothetical protein [Burkholderia cepacia]